MPCRPSCRDLGPSTSPRAYFRAGPARKARKLHRAVPCAARALDGGHRPPAAATLPWPTATACVCRRHHATSRASWRRSWAPGPPWSERIYEAHVVYFATYRLNLPLRSKEDHARTVPSPGSFSCSQLASHNCLLAWCITLLSSRCVR